MTRAKGDGLQPEGDSRRPLGLAAFGLGLLTDLAPPGAWEARALTGPIVRLRPASTQAIAEIWSGLEGIGWEGTIDGVPFVVERGRAGDHRFVHGAGRDRSRRGAGSQRSPEVQAVHHLSADASVLRCAPSNSSEPAWWRVVLDSVLFTVALLHGYEALHAGALATSDGAIAIAAGAGGGKSTLVGELLLRGLTLMTDDVLVLERSDAEGPPFAHPGPPLMTVPAERISMLREALPSAAPRTIAALEREHWVAVPVHPQPLRLHGLVVLNRRPGLALRLHRAEKPLAALMESLLRFPRTRERERARFELAGAIAAHVPIWELEADPSVDPGTLAGLLLAELAASRRDGRATVEVA